MPKIVLTDQHDFTPEQRARLSSLGEVTFYDKPAATPEEYLERVKDANIICTGTAGLKDVYADLKNVYITVSFVSVAFVDIDVLRRNNVVLSNAPGANKHAVSEWITYMLLSLSRNFLNAVNRTETYRKDGAFPPNTPGLTNKNLTILGKGNVGQQVGRIAETLGMNISFFTRNDDLYESVANADYVVDTLSSNPSTEKILDKKFFGSMKQNSFFITITRQEVVDEDAMLDALDNGNLAGVASDCGGILVGDTDDLHYQRLLKHPKVLVTPHISYSSDMSSQRGNDIMIDNVEAYINGTPQNVVT